MIQYIKFREYRAYNAITMYSTKFIKVEIYNVKFRIDFFDYTSINKKEAIKKLRLILNKGIDDNNEIIYIKDKDYTLRLNFIK
jgi:hypothetical protein